MSDWASITDPSNPFNTTGLSDEVEAILDYIASGRRAGLAVVATATTDHPMYTSSGSVSRHRMAGTNGTGLAVDCRLATRGVDIHRAVFDMFTLVEAHLQELIYAGAPYSIKAGKRVPRYASASHHDHVHVAVTKGRLIAWPGATPQPGSWKWEDYMPKPLDITSAAPAPSGGHWKQSAEGGIYAYDGAQDIDAYNRHPELGGGVRYFVALVPSPAGGYIQIANDGGTYRWDPR